jgi:histidinol-phosphatase (PHP family)
VEQFDCYLVEAHRLKMQYASQIILLVGIETEFITGADLDKLDALLARAGDRIEYIVGSVHHVNGIPIDFDLATYHKSLHSLGGEAEQHAQELFLSAYFDAQYDLILRFRPEIIGHIDLCRLYNPELKMSSYPLAWQKLERNIIHAINYGALFEVNAAAFRKKWDTAYPGLDVVEVKPFTTVSIPIFKHGDPQLVLKHRGRFALSDDSHGPHAVGLNYGRLAEYLQTASVSELWYLQKTDTQNAAGRRIQPARLAGKWSDSAFWCNRSS